MASCPFDGSTKYEMELKGGIIFIDEEWGMAHPLTCSNCGTQFSLTCPACGQEEAVGRNTSKPISGEYQFGCWYCGGYWNREQWLSEQVGAR